MRIVVCFFLVCVIVFGKVSVVEQCDCFETLEKNIIRLVHGKAGKISNNELNKELKAVIKKECPDKIKKKIVIDNSSDIKDCIQNLESEIIKIVKNSQNDKQEIFIDILIDNINKNFKDCKKKANCNPK